MNGRLKHNPDFRRLKLGGRGILARTTHWLGKDHLLVVEIGNYTERYRRFYFRDVQAAVVQQTQARLWWSFGLAIVSAFCLFAFAYGMIEAFSTEPTESGALIFAAGFGLLTFLGGLGLVRSLLGGPTCTLQIRTAVQTQRIRGVTRWRKAETLMNELIPLIQAAQAGAEATPMSESSAPAEPSSAAAAPPVQGEPTL